MSRVAEHASNGATRWRTDPTGQGSRHRGFPEREQPQRSAPLVAAGTGTFRWDIRTSALDSDEALDRLLRLGPGRGVRSLGDIAAAYELGANGYLVKPPNSEKLIELVAALRDTCLLRAPIAADAMIEMKGNVPPPAA